MKKCIIYYSKTGNTKQIAEKFEGFDLLEIRAQSTDPNQRKPVLVDIPNFETYDYIIFASPVHGFQLPHITRVYLDAQDTFKGKIIDLFITHFFPFSWLGGKQALSQMEKIINAKGGIVRYKTSINWKSRKKEQTIHKMLNAYQVEKKVQLL